jgi:hypothetical protein
VVIGKIMDSALITSITVLISKVYVLLLAIYKVAVLILLVLAMWNVRI